MESIKVYPGLQRMRGARLDAAGPELRVICTEFTA